MTIACTANACNNQTLRVRIGNVGTPSGRAAALTNFTVAMGTAVLSAAPTGTNPITFNIGGIARGGTATFYVGADFSINGNDGAAATGNATSGYYVFVSLATTTPTGGSTGGLAHATVLRPILVTANANLAFGRILRPSTGAGSASVDAATGARSLTGTGALGLSSPTPTRATYSVSGEGGQAFSLGLPGSVSLTGPGTPLTVALTSTATGAQTLSSALGSAGTFAFGVGGSFPVNATTATGLYQGTFAVTVQYN